MSKMTGLFMQFLRNLCYIGSSPVVVGLQIVDNDLYLEC